jgi:LAO/AO transport system kinase
VAGYSPQCDAKIAQPLWLDYDAEQPVKRMREAKHAEVDVALGTRIVARDRRALARAITLIESTKKGDQQAAEILLTSLLPRTGRSIRIGISGAPGVGKSTFIETFGQHLSGEGMAVAVLAIDPSSRRSGGSILGDNTRMEKLARDPNAFIRPSPAGSTPGGVARRTRESLMLAEAAGFDVVIVETVGIGQAETTVSDMTDVFVVLVAPGGGDELQGIKRGIMELADLLLITKADGDLAAAAKRTQADYAAAMHLMRPKYEGLAATVMSVSSLKDVRIAEAWSTMKTLHAALKRDGRLKKLRQEQSRRWFWQEIQTVISETVVSNEKLARQAARLEGAVATGKTLPYAAARTLIEAIR